MQEKIPLCQIAERVYLSSADVGKTTLEKMASRQVDIAAGVHTFRLHQMPAGFGGIDAENLLDFQSFLDVVALNGSERTDLLISLFGTGAYMLRLHCDQMFVSFARSISTMPGLPKAAIGLDRISGCDTAIATIPMRAGFRPDDLVVGLTGDCLALGRIESVHDFLAWENPRQRLATISFSGDTMAGGSLLIGAAGLVQLDVTIRLHTTAEAFYAEYARTDPDFVGLYTQTNDDAAVVLNRLIRQAPPLPVVYDQLLSVKFVLDEAISLADGLFASGWFHDPDGRIVSVSAVDHSLAETEISAVWKLFDGRSELLGKAVPAKRFAAFLKRVNKQTSVVCAAIRVLLDNGESHLISAEPVHDLLSQRDRILGCIADHAFTLDMLEDVFRPAIGPIQEQLNARQCVRDVKAFGPPSTRRVSLIIPLYRETGFLRSQLMAFAVDSYVRQHCEIIYVLDDPLIATDVVSQIEGFVFAFPLDLKLVILDRNGGYALANNIGVSEAKGDSLILMNSDVIPTRSGWIEPALEKLYTLAPFSVVGPKLIYADNSLQHAGLYFYQLSNGYWQNFHFWKGYGRNFAPANRERVVPAVTGACMILRKADYLAVGGFTVDFIVGDFEDSDLCMKLRQRKGVPFYMPAIELYHFERQSMPAEREGQDQGSSIYNSALHTKIWSDDIEVLMATIKDAAHVA